MSKRSHVIEQHFQNGLRLYRAGRFVEAETLFRNILSLGPHADSLNMLGVLARLAGQYPSALACIEQAIALKPSVALYHVNRASALLALGQMDAALAACALALDRKRNCAEAYQVQGHILSDLGRQDAAIAAYQQALRHNPALPDLHDNLGLALRLADRLEEAEAALREAVRREPQNEHALSNLAGVLKELGRLDEAEAQYREAIRLRPDNAGLHFNLGFVLLLAGRFDEGWAEYAWRFKAGVAQLPPCSQPEWDGAALAGRTLLVRAEQGFGDTIEFCRFLPAPAPGDRVILEVQPRLVGLLKDLPRATQVIAEGETPPPFDVHCPLLSLPRLGIEPMPLPYLRADAARVAKWRGRLGTHGTKIGIVWQGNPHSPAERGRSIPLDQFRALAGLPGIRLISLQKRDGMEQLAALATELGVETLGEGFDAGPDAFLDTAAVIPSLDLVITADTAVGHVAGALGRPVWVALQYVSDWRWVMGQDSSPLYPSLRLFRQTARGDWAGVFARMAHELAARAA